LLCQAGSQYSFYQEHDIEIDQLKDGVRTQQRSGEARIKRETPNVMDLVETRTVRDGSAEM
jgi:hypothetical protein